MEQWILTLTPFGKKPLSINLSQGDSQESVAEQLVGASGGVYSNLSYRAELSGGNVEKIKNVLFYVNDILVPCEISNGHIQFLNHKYQPDRIFVDCFGFVEMYIILQYEDQAELRLHSNYVSVFVRQCPLNDSVQAMADYVYAHQSEFLFYDETKLKDSSERREGNFQSLESKIALAEEILAIYENSYGFFKANCKFKIKQEDVVDRLEKLKFISSKTLQYIATHPEQLKQVSGMNGIRIAQRTYHPQHTLIAQNIYSADIYENRVVVGFLKTIICEIQSLADQASSLLSKLPQAHETSGEYIQSSYFIYCNIQKMLINRKAQLYALQNKFESLLHMYNAILNVTNTQLIGTPKPTSIFLSVPQYNRIFIRIHQWLHDSICDVWKETFLLSLIKISSLYEKYVLAKLIRCMKESGYTLDSQFPFLYPVSDRSKYKNTQCCNTYLFSNATQTLTVYYQPVIFDTNSAHMNGIGLYRNNTISLSSDKAGERRGHYYAPDFLIKINTAGHSRYVICDAKFSSLSTVRNHYVSLLAYKYLFSISPIDSSDSVSGLAILYGQCTSEDVLSSVYDKQLSEQKITPFAALLPFMEGIHTDNQLPMIHQLIEPIG